MKQKQIITFIAAAVGLLLAKYSQSRFKTFTAEAAEFAEFILSFSLRSPRARR